jgi:hypothetical protein
MRIRKHFLAFAPLVCLSLLSQTPATKTLSTAAEIETVDFCDLTVHPKLYVGKLVRVKASYVWWWESSYLYNTQCKTDQREIHNGLDCSGDLECQRLSKEIYDYFDKSEVPHVLGFVYKSDVTIVGRLAGPKRSGFGHLGSFKFEFRIRKVESASPVVRSP